ncbi:hypothetical protein ACMD2_04368 [Ananas comosus]|uniref:Uncharacterized protein n=1 Tax=Ananas comosus TaxID=4615 RepID=A0A199UHU5_ANACO|nr:hypothetical protein ACMD2_04368 [Ananas comosus]
MQGSSESSPFQKFALRIPFSWLDMANFGWRGLEMGGSLAPTRRRSRPRPSPSYGTSPPPSRVSGPCSC